MKVVTRRKERLENSRLLEYGRSWLNEKNQETTQASDVPKNHKEIVEECISYILSNLDNPELSVNELATRFFLNPIYLNRIFKREKKVAISQFIISEKMALAAQLLKDSSNSVVAIAEKVGYPNYSYFSTIFKKYYGCTPTQYRAEQE